ncbi:hypothetical protein QYE76_036834 [Lolium multiflorum]|uniref:CCHC-type domain-containing protein n=1 Tax=Lolium multiflorum TaxID=4521 RepID=A0AAD8VPR0_LOLMU|nr:hypothetical protein QYE76_036834 [Lolium multiflorum]
MAAPTINFNQFLEKEKLKNNGSNFTDWIRHVRIVLNAGQLQYVLDAPLGPPPAETAPDDVKNVYQSRKIQYSQVQCAILCGLEAELQKRFENHDPCEIVCELKAIFETHAAVESCEVSEQFFGCMMEEGSSVSENVLKMCGHAKKLNDLGIVIPNQLGIHRVLQSLPPSYKNFVMNYNMQCMNKELPELFSMPKTTEIEINKEHQVLMVNKTTSFKKQGKSKEKGNFKKGGKKAAAPPKKPKAGPKPDTVCYYCKGDGHWKRNCPKYLADLKSGHVKKKAYVKKLQPDKLEPKAEKCIFIGYPKETIGYTFYHRSEGKVFVAKNRSFLEKEFLTKEVTGRKVELDEVIEPSLGYQSSAAPEDVPVPPAPIREEANDDDHETSNEVATEPRRSTRARTTPDWYDPYLNVMIVDNNDEDPATYEEAMMSPDSKKWQEAMKSEMGSMYDNKVWTLVDLPDSRKAVENKWIFKRKTDADGGNITVYKARLVAKGFRQIQGVDYDETFSPVAKLKSVRILLAIAAFFDYEIWQMDVKTAFLNGDIEEELYMVQPKGFIDPKNADKLCKRQRSIYGLEQASRSWNRCFDKVIKNFGFIQTHDDSKSQSGYVFIFNGAAVSWMSAKQSVVAKSSTESEYIAASEASSEAIWMKRFITELGVVPSALDPLTIYCDNIAPHHLVHRLPLTLLKLLVHAVDREEVSTAQHLRAETRPETPTRARTRMVTPQSATGRRRAPSTQRSPRPLLSPTASPRRQLARRHRQLDALALSPSSRTTTIRRSTLVSDDDNDMAPPTRSTNQDAMLQMLQMMMAHREAERAERQTNIAALQQLANNNQGHHDHPGSKLKNFQNTNPPIFNKTEEPLDADDWLQTMENNLEVAGVEAAEKVLFATHYLAGPARAWWTSTRAMNAGQMMTWEDFKLKLSKYHVPQGLIKKMRDEFRELKQGRMSVVEYRDRFLTLSRYAPDETDTNEKRKERFLNGLHDEMQTVLVNIPFADLEALVDSAIQMEGKLHQANENRKRRMMNQNGPNNAQK